MTKVLHIAAHLGGGVGRVISSVVRESRQRGDGVSHTVACLEAAKNPQFGDKLVAAGGELLACPSGEELLERIRRADIVQLEWWHHPIMAQWMCAAELPPCRLIVWSHISGLSPPVIPPAFLLAPHRFLFTSPCSWHHPSLAELKHHAGARVDVVFSAGGFDDLPSPPQRPYDGRLRTGYVGTLNPAKLHPQILEYLVAVRLPDFRLAMVGDPSGAHELVARAEATGLADRLELRGYRPNVEEELAQFDVLAYVLNPLHYGTTENALLEAMAMGVVPVVLDNPAERYLVIHDETGLIVSDPTSFAVALDRLAASPDELRRLSANAAREVRSRFAANRTADQLNAHYRALMDEPKRAVDFRPIFGKEPADWFLACQGDESWRFSDDVSDDRRPTQGPHFLYEATKSSAFHFRDIFPGDARLKRWTERLMQVR